MFDYLECLMEGLKTMGGDQIRSPERRRFDPDESCKFFSWIFLMVELEKENVHPMQKKPNPVNSRYSIVSMYSNS